MSLSVLVGQRAHWEGAAKARRRVVVPPPPETLKTIRDLVAGVTGFNETRGDQLIVETLPFESTVDSDPAQFSSVSTAQPSTGPPWLNFILKYQSVWMIAIGLLVCFAALLRMALKFMSQRPKEDSDEMSPALPSAAYESRPLQPLTPTVSSTGLPEQMPIALLEADQEAAGRIRTLAQNDPGVAANVVRMWLQNQRV
jgi:flagellar M-ring protein FliF